MKLPKRWRMKSVFDGPWMNSDESVDLPQFAACMGFDAYRLAVGIPLRHFDETAVLTWLLSMFAQLGGAGEGEGAPVRKAAE